MSALLDPAGEALLSIIRELSIAIAVKENAIAQHAHRIVQLEGELALARMPKPDEA